MFRRSVHAQQQTPAVSRCLPLSPAFCNPSKLHIVTHRLLLNPHTQTMFTAGSRFVITVGGADRTIMQYEYDD